MAFFPASSRAALIAALTVALPGHAVASHCALQLKSPLTVAESLAPLHIDSVAPHTIVLSATDGDRTDPAPYERRPGTLHYDGLYRLQHAGQSWYFRFGKHSFNADGTGRTRLENIEWADNRSPGKSTADPEEEPVVYTLARVQETIPPHHGKTLTTVGDSITWWNDGEQLRCRLADEKLPYRFTGSHTDTFGYGHEGEGGNTTQQVLQRLDAIVTSDRYFLLIGTNDRTPETEIVKRIFTIARALRDKQPEAQVYVSTLLPRGDEFRERNARVNDQLRAAFAACTDCDQLILVDTERAFTQRADWPTLFSDGLHPNVPGYQYLAHYLATQLK